MDRRTFLTTAAGAALGFGSVPLFAGDVLAAAWPDSLLASPEFRWQYPGRDPVANDRTRAFALLPGILDRMGMSADLKALILAKVQTPGFPGLLKKGDRVHAMGFNGGRKVARNVLVDFQERGVYLATETWSVRWRPDGRQEIRVVVILPARCYNWAIIAEAVGCPVEPCRRDRAFLQNFGFYPEIWACCGVADEVLRRKMEPREYRRILVEAQRRGQAKLAPGCYPLEVELAYVETAAPAGLIEVAGRKTERAPQPKEQFRLEVCNGRGNALVVPKAWIGPATTFTMRLRQFECEVFTRPGDLLAGVAGEYAHVNIPLIIPAGC